MSSVEMVNALSTQAMSEPNMDDALRRLQAAAPHDAQKAAEGFEAIFLTQFVSSMFSGLDADGLFGGGNGEKMWQGFLTQHIAEAFAERGGIGIADMVLQQINQSSEGFNE
ncbi:MAG: rod-binding protein [Pseudomonadota bacterium]